MSAKDISNILFSFDNNIKASEVRDFLAKQGIEASEHTVRSYKALVTKRNR